MKKRIDPGSFLDEAKTDTSTVQQAQQRSQSTTAALSGDDGIAEEKQKSGSSTGKDDQPRASSPSVDTPEAEAATQTARDKTTQHAQNDTNILAETSQKEAHSEGRGVESSPDTKPAAETSEEGLSAFTKGVVAGDFYENDSWSATAGKIVGGIAPPADARDVAAAVTHIAQGKEGAWSDLGWSLVGSVPLVGDTIKAVGKGSDVARGATKASGKTVDDVAASGKTADEVGGGKNVDKPYSNPKNRPPYGEGQVDEVWDKAKQPDGNVYDPNTGEKLEWDKTKSRAGQWDMGHNTGKEYRKLHKDYMDEKITKEEFLKEYLDPNNYKPEDPSSNRSGQFEEK